MSLAYLNAAFASPTGSPTAKAVLLALADRANDGGICFSSLADIARRTELDRRTILRALKRLQRVGAVTVDRAGREGRSSLYRLHWRHPATGVRESPVSESHPCQRVTRVAVTPPPVSESHPTSDSVTPITVTEPPREPSPLRGGCTHAHAQEARRPVVGRSCTFQEAIRHFAALEPRPEPPYTEAEISDVWQMFDRTGWRTGDKPVRDPFYAIEGRMRANRHARARRRP